MTARTKLLLLTSLFAGLTFHLFPQKPFTLQQKTAQCAKIKAACQYAWAGYKQYANGFDALAPLSKKGHNWYSVSFMMTPLDAFDTFYLMGLKDEAAQAKEMVINGLSFDVDVEVQLFEVNIRLLGGLISAYELSGDERLLNLAKNLGIRLFPAFNSPTGMPYRYVNLKTGKTRDSLSNPAEIGTYLLEFGKLTRLTHDSSFYKAAKRAAFEVYRRRSDIDLVGTTINVNTGAWKNTESQIGAPHRFLLRIPVQGLAAVWRYRLQTGMGGPQPGDQKIPLHRGAVGGLFYKGGHAFGQGDPFALWRP